VDKVPSPVEVRTVRLEHFRNYTSLELPLSTGFNILAGPNAQGKTNFLEALYLIASTRLLRGRRDAEAVQDTAERAIATVEVGESRTQLTVTLERGSRKRALINGLALPRAADIIGRLPCVCVSSADMAIVRGEPTDRRLFLDLELSSLSPGYLRHFSLYKRALEQRNALLREARERSVAGAVFEPWEEQMAEHGEAVRRRRRDYVRRLAVPTAHVHRRMGAGEVLQLAYTERDEAADIPTFREMLAESRLIDMAKGGTSIGPHRDDLTLEIDEREARHFGSQGQQRTSVIALKMACLEVAQEELGVPPLLLLDDILSDLDEARRALLVEVVLERAGQAVLTCTEASAAGDRILSQATVFEVRAGTVKPR
jgi:DNA replication and repair protein RecF